MTSRFKRALSGLVRSSLCAISTACAVAAWYGAPARAQSAPTHALNWVRDEGAEQCITSARLATGLESLVGPILQSPSEAERAVEGFVRRDARSGRWHVRVRLLDRAGNELGVRTLERDDADCRSLDRSILLIAALTIAPAGPDVTLPSALLAALASEDDPGPALLSELERNPPAPVVLAPPAAPQAAPVAAAPLSPREPPAELRAGSRLAGEIALSGAWLFGLLPSSGVGARLAGRLLMPRRVSVEASLRYAARRDAELNLGGAARFRAADATLLACGTALDTDRLALALCAGATAGSRLVRTRGLLESRGHTRPYWGPNVTGELRYRLSQRWFALLTTSAAALWPRDRFVYEDAGQRSFAFYRPSRFSADIAIGAAHRF